MKKIKFLKQKTLPPKRVEAFLIIYYIINGLFPFDSSRWLWRHIVTNAVYARNFLEDTVCNLHKDRPFDLFDRSSHRVDSVHGTDDNWPVVRTCIVAYTYALEVRHYGEVLPYLLVEASESEFFAEDSV